eukprot:2912901-Prymnesium_polylepis.1
MLPTDCHACLVHRQAYQRTPLNLFIENICPRALNKMERAPERYEFYMQVRGPDATGMARYPVPYKDPTEAEAGRQSRAVALTYCKPPVPDADSARASLMEAPAILLATPPALTVVQPQPAPAPTGAAAALAAIIL